MRAGDPKQPQHQTMGRYLAWSLMLVAVFFYVYTFSSRQHAHVETIAYSQFKQDVRKGEIAKITMRGHEIRGALERPPGTHGAARGHAQAAKSAVQPTQRRFTTTIPQVPDPGLLPLLEKHHVTVRAESTHTAWWLRALVGFLPWLILFGLIFYGSYKMQQRAMGGEETGGIFGFRKSPAKRFREEVARVGFDEVAGLENAKDDLREIVDYLKEPERYRGLGAKVPKGVLLVGAPGTGKTLLARAVAGEAGATFYSISGSEFIEMLVGVGAARVRDLFRAAKQEAPAIIFVDEIDSVGRARGTGMGGGNDEREQTLNQILSEMDGFAPHQNVVVLAATNRPDVLDPALLRPGRFDRKVVLDLPDRKARRKILEIHTRRIPLAEDVDLDKVATRSVGFSGADIENLANEAALLTGRDRRQEVDMATLERARDKIVLGAERETILSDEDRTIVAYHESGHALVAWLGPNADPLGKVSIIPRGRALGVTEQTPAEERYNLRRSYLLERLAVMLGGRVAESIVFGDVSSGAEADLKAAAQLARRMVCRWGMSERLGAVALPQGEEHIFLGREMAQSRDFSEHTAQLVDEEIRRLVGDAARRDEDLLGAHRAQLDALAEALLQSETLEHDEIDRILLASASREAQRQRPPISA